MKNKKTKLPGLLEVMIEVEPRCNFKCQFCFNKISFAKKGRDFRAMDGELIKRIIGHLADLGVPKIRFTGGEPLLRQDLFELMAFAKKKGLQVNLNTNGSLVTEAIAKKMKGLVDGVLISIESPDNDKESEITGFKNALAVKTRGIKTLAKAGVVCRVGTVISAGVADDFDRFAKFISGLPVKKWEFFRPVPLGKKWINAVDFETIEKLAIKTAAFKRTSKKEIAFANALPFCCVKDLWLFDFISHGGTLEEGRTRIVIDARGFVKPFYFIEKKLGSPLDLEKAWNHPFLKAMREMKNVPKECRQCLFLKKCCGGTRYAAKLATGNWKGRDPMARYAKLMENFGLSAGKKEKASR